MLLRDLFRNLYVPIRLLGRSPRTVTLYEHTVSLFDGFLGRPADLSDLDDLTVARHLQQLLGQGYARASVAKERSQLLALANFAAKRGLIGQWLEVRTVPVPHKIPLAWTVDEMQRLLAACQAAPGHVGHVRASIWWTSLHLVAWDSGERIGALLCAEWSHLQADSLLVPGEHRKGITRDRIYALRPETVTWVEWCRKPDRQLIWPWPHAFSILYYQYSKILRSAGLPTDSKSKFHRIRRSFASHLKAAGIDPQLYLDHANSRTTQAYLDPRIASHQLPRDNLPRVI